MYLKAVVFTFTTSSKSNPIKSIFKSIFDIIVELVFFQCTNKNKLPSLSFRYYALSDPIEHARRRTTKFILGTIAIVWFLSIVISSPPLAGWNDWPDPANWTIGNNLVWWTRMPTLTKRIFNSFNNDNCQKCRNPFNKSYCSRMKTYMSF